MSLKPRLVFSLLGYLGDITLGRPGATQHGALRLVLLLMVLGPAGLPMEASAQSPPSIVTQPANRTNLVGTTATFVVGAIGTEPLHYQWFFNGTNAISSGTNSALVLSA